MNFQGVVQYDEEGSPITIKTVCDVMENGTDADALSNFARVNSMLNPNCLECNYENTTRMLRRVRCQDDI